MSEAGQTLIPRLLVGFSLGLVFLTSLLDPRFFAGLIVIVATIGTYELATALRTAQWRVPRFPSAIAAVAIVAASFLGGAQWQWMTFVLAVVWVLAWRLAELSLERDTERTIRLILRDSGAIVFVLLYVPLLLSFTVLLIRRPDGIAWLLGMVVTIVSIDTSGYLIGRFLGKTKLAPTLSPKKTWEGLAASVTGGFLGGLLMAQLVGAAWYWGLIFAVAFLATGVLGDLSESIIKRDLGLKDMGHLLPGHGGILDRLDSLLPTSFIAYLLATVFFSG